MSTYNPDHWVIIKVTPKDGEELFKVLGDWSGSYLEGRSWRISSGITHVAEDAEQFTVTNHSGSIYHLRKGGSGLGVLSSGILAQYTEALGPEVIRQSSIEEAVSWLRQAEAVKLAASKIAPQ